MRRRYQHQTISQRIFGSLPAAAETIFSTDSCVDRLHSPKSAGVTSVEHQPEICSSHEETDVRIIIYIKYIQTTMSHIKDHQDHRKGLCHLLYTSLFCQIVHGRYSYGYRREVDQHEPVG